MKNKDKQRDIELSGVDDFTTSHKSEVTQNCTSFVLNEPLLIEISPGELIDKITILKIKSERIKSSEKLTNIYLELQYLCEVRDLCIPALEEVSRLTAKLTKINTILWDVEEKLRQYEENEDFGSQFVDLARSVYKMNDSRSEVKRSINIVLGSRFIEEKSYATIKKE